MAAPRIAIGSRVLVATGEGTVRWIGTNPAFAQGDWVGVELFEPNGKNDGTVQGTTYFHCQSRYGVFVKAISVKTVDGNINPAASSSRPQSSLSILSGNASPARRPSSSQTFSPSQPASSSSNLPSNPLQQKLSRAAAGLSASSSSSRDLAGLAGLSRRGSVRPNPTDSQDRRASSPTPSPSSTPTPAPRPVITTRPPRPSSTLSQTTSAGLPRPSAISAGWVPARPGSSASTHSRLSRPSSVASNIEGEDDRPSSRASQSQLLAERITEGRQSAASTRTLEVQEETSDPIEELQATPKASTVAEPRRYGRGLAQSLIAKQSARKEATNNAINNSNNNNDAKADGPSDQSDPADFFRAARSQRAASSIPENILTGTTQSVASNEITNNPAGGLTDRGGEVSKPVARQIEEMANKIRRFEARRVEDAERIKSLELKVGEGDRQAEDLQKLTTRFREIMKELKAQRALVKELQEGSQTEAELRESFEEVLVERELADEKAAALEAQVHDLVEKVQGLEADNEILLEEAAKYDQPAEPGEERSSVALIQLERQNERLKEALVRLRDVSTDTEKQLKSRIVELEKETSGNGRLKDELGKVRGQLEDAEEAIDDLKQQLDVALGAEDMLEQLTERTLTMGEKIEEMRIHIEDLEAIKEMNDEMEEGHIETEKHLQTTLESLAADLREQKDREADLEVLVADREGRILQFRDLVQGLQSELNDLWAKHHETEAESHNLSTQSQAMLNMNLKLQNSASKTQARVLDLALARIEAKVAREYTEIMQAYLPASYFEADSEATNAVLLVHRLAGKADILVSTFCQMHNLPDALIDVNNDRLPGVCEVRGLITVFANILARLAGSMMRGPPQEFLALARLNIDFAPIEEKVDHWFDLIRRNEFSERDCSLELAGYVGELEQVLSSFTSGVELDVAERQLGFALAFDYELDNFAASVGLARHGILDLVNDPDALVEDPVPEIEQEIFEPVQRILNQVRAVKLNSMKLVELVRNVANKSTALEHDLQTPLRMISESVSRATDVAVQLAQKIGGHLNDLRGSQEPLRLSIVLQFLQEVTSAINPQGDIKPWDIIGMFVTRLGTDLNSLLPRIQTAVEQGNLIHTGFAGPWILRADALRADLVANAEAESRLVSQAEEITSLLREIKTRDQILEETRAKFELMDRRLENSKNNADMLSELEVNLKRATGQELEAREQAQKLQLELSNLETENAQLRQLSASGSAGEGARPRRAGGVASDLDDGQATHLVDEIAKLKTAIDIIRRENILLKAEGLLGQMRALPALPHAIESVPALDADEAKDNASSESDSSPQTPQGAVFQRPTTVQKKHLWRQLANVQASASVIDITQVKPGRGWQPLRRLPEAQMSEKLRMEERVVRNLKSYLE